MRRTVTIASAALLIFGFVAAPGLAQDHPGTPPTGDPEDICNEPHNNLRSKAEEIDLDEGDVVEKTSDPDAPNFEEEFTFWRVDHGVAYDESVYREPARVGPKNFCLGGFAGGSFWFGVSAPDADGIQHKIDHKGGVDLYLQPDAGDNDTWMSLRVQFDGRGNLLHVNGVEPVEE